MLIIATLIFLGILLMIVEMLLIPGVGIAGILGLVSLIGACFYAFAHIGTAAGLTVTIVIVCLIVAMLMYVLREKTWKRFETDTVIDSKVNEDNMLVKTGDQGVSVTRLAPMGTARFGTTSCEVKSADNKMIDAGTAIEVAAVEDNKILVKPIND